MPGNGIAYASRAEVTDLSHGIMVSLFPYDMTDVGITAGNTVEIKAEAVSWRPYKISMP